MCWRHLWKLSGLAILAVAAAAVAAEAPTPNVWNKLCLAALQHRADFGEAGAAVETMTLEDAKQLMIEMSPEKYAAPGSDIPDEEARALIEDIKVQTRTLPRVISSFCDMNARHTLPMPGYEFPEHGELSVSGRYQTPETIVGYGVSSLRADTCPQPFLLRMGITGGGHDDRLHYIFCETDGVFALFAAYATDRGDPPEWRAIR